MIKIRRGREEGGQKIKLKKIFVLGKDVCKQYG
jgi:hypothetical protein